MWSAAGDRNQPEELHARPGCQGNLAIQILNRTAVYDDREEPFLKGLDRPPDLFLHIEGGGPGYASRPTRPETGRQLVQGQVLLPHAGPVPRGPILDLPPNLVRNQLAERELGPGKPEEPAILRFPIQAHHVGLNDDFHRLHARHLAQP